MIKLLIISSWFFLAVLTTNAQLTANTRSIEAGRINDMGNCQIQIPLLNQSHDVLVFSLIPENNRASVSIPDSLGSYEHDYFTFSPGYLNTKKFHHKLIFESSQGDVIVTVKGRLSNNSGNQDCYDFNKKQVRVKTSGKYHSETKLTSTVRIYAQKEKNTLFVADPKLVPFTHLIVLIDASGSMGSEEKLEKIKENLYSMLDEMRPPDYISILRYSEGTEVIVDQQSCGDKEEIKTAITSIKAGGFTDGKNGIESALEHAHQSQVIGYTNNVIVFTDGAFNLGSEQEEIERYLLGQNRILNYKLSVLTIKSEKNNNKDMKALSNSGNGYHFILDEDAVSKTSMNKILLKQLST